MNPSGNRKHGQHGTLTYSRWKSMRQRAAKQHGPYATVECCARWASFDAFLADMGECPEGHTLDRIDNQHGYEPGNCRWATMADQNANRSSVVMLTQAGACKSVADWARELGISANTIRMRLRLGWDAERALTTPAKAQGSK
jgi:hypothetical protein